jgi:predicted nucleotidyltransferase
MQVPPSVPETVREVIHALVASARSAFGDQLTSVVLYGSAAEGRMRATSDVNLLFVLNAFDAERANAFREPYRVAQAAANVIAMFVLQTEIDVAAAEFAQKFADIKRRHMVLHGNDPLSAIEIPRDALVKRVQQVLLNGTMRLRETYIERSLREEQCAMSVAGVTGLLRTSAAAMLELEGGGVVAPKEALERLIGQIDGGRFTDLIPHLSEAREQRALPAGRAAEILFDTLELARALFARARSL